MRNLDQRALGVAIQQQVALGIDHDRAAHLVRPIVVVGNAAQTAFNAAEHNRHVLEGFPAALAVDDRGAVRPPATDVAGRVGIVAADFSVRRVAVDHGVHVARRHTPKQIGLAQSLERFRALPVGLRDDADPETLGFQHAANHRHAKTGVIHIGIARHEDDVATVPTQLIHLLAAHGQELGNAKARRPELAVTGQWLGGTREKRDVNEGVHENSNNGKGPSVRFGAHQCGWHGYSWRGCPAEHTPPKKKRPKSMTQGGLNDPCRVRVLV